MLRPIVRRTSVSMAQAVGHGTPLASAGAAASDLCDSPRGLDDAAASARCSLSVPGPDGKRRVRIDGVELLRVGGACARLVVRVVCARAPSLISVLDPAWLRAGDMMVDGVIPL